MFNKNMNFPRGHQIITPDNNASLSREMIIYVVSAGDVRIADDHGNELTYPAVPAHTTLPVVASKVLATGTTSTLIYGLTD